MSKKYKKKRREFPWPLLVFGVLLLGAAAFLFLSRGGGDGGGTPAIALDTELIDYGDVKLDTPLTFSIKVTNKGNGVLRFKEEPYIEVREGC